MRSKKQIKTRSALEIRAAAGRAPQRRGSALLIVIGTLALVAVFAAVYVSIGRTDRRGADAFTRQQEQRDDSVQAGEMFADVIGMDRLENLIYYSTQDPNTPLARRELTDTTYTDWTRRSEAIIGNPAEEALLFTPSGGVYRADGLNAMTDFRVANDPWLASTTPTFLGTPGDPLGLVDVDSRTFSRSYEYSLDFPNAWGYLDNRDWLQISNFAPDGRPVNLFNLRPHGTDFQFRSGNVASNSIGGFDAEPGIGESPRPSDGRQIRRMSNYLSLLEMTDPADPQSLLKAFDPADEDGLWLPGFAEKQNTGLTAREYFNTPAVWTMYQRFMFMPMNQPFVINNRQGNISTWADPDYPQYQYADADGDGFADSRWFEFVSARDRDNGELGSNSAREDIRRLFDKGDMRYFFAARAIDLSSMVNVNTATDQLAVPTAEYPMGLTPAEVDLRRLLTMQDAAQNYASNFRGAGTTLRATPLSLDAAARPYTDRANLATNFVWTAGRERPDDFIRDPQDYQFYQATTPVAALTDPDLRELEYDSPSMMIGRYAYSALRRAIVFGGTPSDNLTGQLLSNTFNPGYTANVETDLLQYEAEFGTGNAIDAEGRYDHYNRVGLQYAATPGLTTSFAGLFGLDDLSELLTYHGINDPDYMSRLERVVDARYDSTRNGGLADAQHTLRMSPLMSNRDLTLDRLSHSRILGDDFTFDMRIAPSAEFRSDPSRIGEISRNSMALMALTPRKRMTTISGYTPLSIDEVFIDPAVSAEMPQALTTTNSIPPLLTDIFGAGSGASQTLFSEIYGPSLAGEISDMSGLSWEQNLDTVDDYNYSTLFYGHRGPELALRIAAHTSVNMADMADADGDPSIATIILDDMTGGLDLRDYRNDLADDLADSPPSVGVDTDPEYQLYPGLVEGNLLDVATSIDPTNNAIDNSNLPDKRTAVNVYGIEAMPVITEVSMLYAFTDAPSQTEGPPADPTDTHEFGDEDYNNRPEGFPRLRNIGGQLRLVPPLRDNVLEVSISTEVSNTNSDYLMQVLAVQLHNPFDEEISLGGSRLDGTPISALAPLTRKREIENDGSIDNDEIDQSSNYHFDYYLEYAGRFFKLAEYIEWYPSDNGVWFDYFDIDDPADTPAYGSNNLSNPAATTGNGGLDRNVGGVMPVTNSASAVYTDFIARNVVLRPGETRVFYAIADQRFDETRTAPDPTTDLPPDVRWRSYLEAWDVNVDNILGNFPWTGAAEEWVVDQLTVMEGSTPNRPAMMMSFDPTNGAFTDQEGAFERLDAAPGSTVPPNLHSDRVNSSLNEVRLWKKVVTVGEEYNNTSAISGATARNLIENDLLVDRMWLEKSLTTDLNNGDTSVIDIAGTWSYPEWFPLPGSVFAPGGEFEIRNDNTGLTISDWVTNRRKDSSTEDAPTIGQITPWMLRSFSTPSDTEFGERYSDYDSAAVDTSDPTAFFSNPTEIPDAEAESIIRTDNEVATSLREFFRYSNQPGYHNIVQTIALEPYAKSNVVSPYGSFSIADNDTENSSTAKFAKTEVINVADLDPTLGSIPEIKVSMSEAQRERPRLTDLLMAWGIGPAYAPDPSRPASGGVAIGQFEDDEWMTLTEAIAIGLGFDDIAAPTGASPDEVNVVWAETWDTAPEAQNALDEGRLALNRFVPYVNFNVTEDPKEFNPLDDRVRKLGIPAAQSVVDRARVFSRLPRITDTPSLNTDPALELTNIVPGAININTAPIEVLRLLPGLSPSNATFANSNISTLIEREWWGARANATIPGVEETNTPDGTLAASLEDLEDNPDVAAAIVAYRDRMFTSPNTSAHVDPAGASRYVTQPLNGRVNSNNVNSVANNFATEDPVFNAGSAGLTLDRQTMTGIDGLRRTPGFSAIGELLSVRVDPDLASTDVAAWNNVKHLSIEAIGLDGEAQGATSEKGTSIVPQVFGKEDNQYDLGGTIDDYSERLALASNVMNMISVRSDIFAVWFVVHGYREADVANLRPEDPLVPSLAKRYLMVVDRSNVVEPGDKPKILMLKEVPL